MEYLVAQPAADQRAGNGGELVGEVGPAGLLDVVTLRVAEVGRGPVETSVAYHVDESVGDGDEPQQFVVQDVFEEDFAGREHFLLLGAVIFRVVVAPFLHRGKAARLRRVADEHVGEDGDEDRDDRREKIGSYQEIEFCVAAAEP